SGQEPRLPGTGAANVDIPPAVDHAVAVSRGAFYFPRPRFVDIRFPSESSKGDSDPAHEGPVSADEGTGVQRPPSGERAGEAAPGASQSRDPSGSTPGPASSAPSPSGSGTVDDLLIRLLHVARQTASLLEEEDPDPERIEVLL